MLIQALKTPRIHAGQRLFDLLDAHVPEMPPGSILAISSKIVSLCEGATAPLEHDKQQLIHEQADYYTAPLGPRNTVFTLTYHTLISSAGIDESNGDGHYVLWPRDPQATANEVRAHLAQRFGISEIGVIITDSASRPLRRGTTGIALAHSGFRSLNSYVGKPDLFGREIKVSVANVSDNLAVAAVLVMGEGAESTPLALISDVKNVVFTGQDPDEAELAELHLSLEDDLFAPLFAGTEWIPGGGAPTPN